MQSYFLISLLSFFIFHFFVRIHSILQFFLFDQKVRLLLCLQFLLFLLISLFISS